MGHLIKARIFDIHAAAIAGQYIPQGNLRAMLGVLLGQRELFSLALRPHAPIKAARMPTIVGYAGRLSASSMVKADEV